MSATKKIHLNANTRPFSQLCLRLVLATGCLFFSYNYVNAASTQVTRYVINGQLSVYLAKKSNAMHSNAGQSSIGPYVNIMLIEKTITEKKTTEVTLAESGFKPISKQPIPFKLSYLERPKYSDNTVGSTSLYVIHVVIADNKSGKPITATMTAAIIVNQNYSDLNLVFQALPEPIY